VSSFTAVFQERTRSYSPLAVSYGLYQHTDQVGRPSSGVRVYKIHVYLDVGDEDANLADWGADPYQQRSGWLLFWNAEGQRFRQVEYRDAYLVTYYVDYQHGRTDWPSHVLVLELSAGAILIDGIEVEAHSTLPGRNAREVRSRARTKAADPAPSPQLRAQASSPPSQTSTASKANSYRKATNKPKANNGGRTGKQARLRELAEDDKLGAADRGWLNQEINAIKRKSKRKGRDGKLRPQTNIRNPPGKDLAHRRGERASQGFSYKTAVLQDVDLHRLEHKHEGYK